MKQKYFLAIACILFFASAKSQSFYDINTVQEIEINFPSSSWDSIMDVNKNTTEDYYMANWVKINGTQYDSAGVRFKGNSSYNANSSKNPLNISLDEYKNNKHQGYTTLKLSNGYGDPSFIREALGYGILKKYMHCPKANFAKVTINGVYYGAFTNDESIDKKFIADHFYSNKNSFVKCSSDLSPSAATKNNLKYIDTFSTSYSSTYDIKSNNGWVDFIDLCNVVTNNVADLPNKIDVDRAIWMLAFDNVFINLDSYIGLYAQNHYVYKDNTGHFNPIVWDLNMCFGAFPFAGQGTIGVGQKSNTELKEYSPFAHATDIAWPLINDVLNDASMKRKYLAHFKTILLENVVNGNYQTDATQYQSIVDNAISSDANKLFSYTQFQGGLNNDVVFGGFTVPGISNLLEARKIYLQTIPELIATEPIINTPVVNNNSPAYNSSVAITTSISNANTSSPYIGYRFDVREKFMQLPLYDDGAHNDANANDGIYGNSITMSGASMQYYIYAENNTIGKFSPARAEHEFYSLFAASSQPTIGDVVINEVLADNATNEKDEYNDREDWVELYNNSSNVIDLSSTYLGTRSDNKLKWKIPTGTYILPLSYMIVWADDDSLEQILHTNFGLNKTSDTLFFSNSIGTILDSVSFLNQLPDVSYGRYPNGTGPFMAMNTSFNSYNINFPLSVNTVRKDEIINLYPNPTQNELTVTFEGKKQVQVSNLYGQKILSTSAKNSLNINTSQWTNGIYILKCGTTVRKFVVSH